MTNKVFADTSFFVALINRNDQYHHQALKLSVIFENTPIITTNIILLEIGNALAKNFKQQAIELIDAILSSEEAQLINLDAALFQKGYEFYQKYQDKNWGLVDCISFVVMKENNITDVLSFDSDFKQAGFRLLHP